MKPKRAYNILMQIFSYHVLLTFDQSRYKREWITGVLLLRHSLKKNKVSSSYQDFDVDAC